MGTEKRKAGVYVRISQDREGLELGVDRQEKDSKALAKRRGWEVVEVYKDNDISAYSGKKRPEWERLLKDLEEHQIDAVVAYSTSRMYRRVRELLRLIDLTKQNGGVEIATVVSGDVNLNTADGRMVAGFLATADQAEAERIGERRKRSNLEKRAAGKHLGGGHRPYGYDRVPGDGFIINQSEKKIVRELVKRVISGESLNRVTADLNVRQITTVFGLKWRPAHVKRMLTKGFHAGLFPDETKGSWPAIITDDEHRILKARLSHLNGKNSGVGRSGKRYVLTGLLFCECGTKMNGSGGKSGSGHYSRLYRCTPRDGGCGNVSVGAKRLEEYIHNATLAHGEKVARATVADSRDEERPGDEAILAAMRKLEDQIDGLASNLDLSEKVLAIRTKALEAKLSGLQAKLAAPRPSTPRAKEEIVRLTFALLDRWEKGELEEADVLKLNAVFAEHIVSIKVGPGPRLSDLSERVRIDWRT